LERLHAIYSRQRAAIDECIQQAANADATLVALLQEGDDASIARRARTWAGDLVTLYDSLAEVLHGEEDVEPVISLPEYRAVHIVADTEDAETGPVSGGVADDPGEEFVRLVEEALRRLNDVGALTRCGLADRLPRTLAAKTQRNGQHGEVTPLEQARALHEVLDATIERLKPTQAAAGAGAP